MNWAYLTIMLLAVSTGFAIYFRIRQPTGLQWWEMLAIGLGAFCGGMIGAKLPFVLADWEGFLSGTAWLDDGKTIVTGLVGGYLGVLLAEWSLDIKSPMCDSFAVPVAVAIGIGRWGCLVGGCCYGAVTTMPWGIDFGDGLARHPTQIYESMFHLSAALILYQLYRRGIWQGYLVRLYFVAYFSYRFLTEFVRPEPPIWMGLTGYQMASLVLAPLFFLWSCPRCRPLELFSWWGKSRGDQQKLRLPLLTRTICPKCLRPLDGETYEDGGQVFLKRECPEHGLSVALISSARDHYYLRDEVPHPPGQGCCGIPSASQTMEESQATAGSTVGADSTAEPDSTACDDEGTGMCCEPAHKTCVALLELTDACNLQCPVCFANSPSGRHRSVESLKQDLNAYLARRGTPDVLQLSGGEPLLHPDLLEILDYAKSCSIDGVMINTNGLLLADNDELASQLAKRKPLFELYLQFDGLNDEVYRAIRGRPLLEKKLAAVQAIVRHDLPATLVCTLTKEVNEDQIGPLLDYAMPIPQIRGLTFQPATWAGRFELTSQPCDRLTLADVVRMLAEQSSGLLQAEDLKPLPCSNPNCCGITVVARAPGKQPVPITRMVDYERHIEQLSDRINFKLPDTDGWLQSKMRTEDFFRIIIKPFMDAHTYDQSRIDECCVHVIRPGGSAVSFCQFNILERGRDANVALVQLENLDAAIPAET